MLIETGKGPPWVWTRRIIAQRWRIPPPLVELYPREEIALEIRLMNIAAEEGYQEWPI